VAQKYCPVFKLAMQAPEKLGAPFAKASGERGDLKREAQLRKLLIDLAQEADRTAASRLVVVII
jgi:hypothetical protein